MFFSNGSKGKEFAHAGIRENNVDSPLHLGDGLVKTIKVGQLGDVALNCRNVGPDCLYSLFELLLATARYEDIGTLLDKKFCRSEPNPFCSAGDDGGLAFELFSHRLSPLLAELSAETKAPLTTQRIAFKTIRRFPVHWRGPLRQCSELL